MDSGITLTEQMLEIVKGRSWSVAHTVYDSEDGPLSDLTGYTFKSQIREKFGTRVEGGDFENKLVADVTVEVAINESIITLSLTQAQVDPLLVNDYQIDLVGTKDGLDEAFLIPEPIRVTNRPTLLP